MRSQLVQTLEALRKVNSVRCEKAFNHTVYGWSHTQWSNAMAGEIGEAIEVVMNAENGGYDTAEMFAGDLFTADLGKELADVVIYADLLADRCGMYLFAKIEDADIAPPTVCERSPAQWTNAIAARGGKVCNLTKKFERGDYDSPKGCHEAFRSDIRPELVCVILYVELLAMVYGIDLAAAIRDKFNEVSDRRQCDIKMPV